VLVISARSSCVRRPSASGCCVGLASWWRCPEQRGGANARNVAVADDDHPRRVRPARYPGSPKSGIQHPTVGWGLGPRRMKLVRYLPLAAGLLVVGGWAITRERVPTATSHTPRGLGPQAPLRRGPAGILAGDATRLEVSRSFAVCGRPAVVASAPAQCSRSTVWDRRCEIRGPSGPGVYPPNMAEQTVLDAFHRFVSAIEIDDILAVCRESTELLTQAAEDALAAHEDFLRQQGAQDLNGFTFGRLMLKSVRAGRNLGASYADLLAARTVRHVRDAVLAEPLLLDPVVDAALHRHVRLARQQGKTQLAARGDRFRDLLANFRHHGTDAGYFDWLARALVEANADFREQLRVENADLAHEFQAHALDRIRDAARLGHHQDTQRLQMAISLLGDQPLQPGATAVHESASQLITLVLRIPDFALWRYALEEKPELLGQPGPTFAASILLSNLNRAALDRDVVQVREWWRRRALLLRCAEVGVQAAFGERERGVTWPSPTETI
jgi:hypothetical protein